ncbi:MAG: hypothetical protein EXS13_10755 [Planctomycetes bacterium]|nr:hypothetical protein [Planctomycetota bacterium]
MRPDGDRPIRPERDGVALVAVAAIGRADRWFMRLGRESLETLLEAAPSKPVLLPTAAVEVHADPDPEPTSPDPAAYVGQSRDQVRAALGDSIAVDRASEYWTLADGTTLRFVFRDEVVVEVRAAEEALRDQRTGSNCPPRGMSWEEVLRGWGSPSEYLSAAWSYNGDDQLAGILVRFEQGLVSEVVIVLPAERAAR